MSDHDQPVAANLRHGQFETAAPHWHWAGDTTAFVLGSRGELYVAAICDQVLGVTVGAAIAVVNDRRLTMKALDMRGSVDVQ